MLSKSVKAGLGFAAVLAFIGLTDLSDPAPLSGVDYLVIALGIALYYLGVLRGMAPLRIAGWVVAIAGMVIGLYGAAT